MIVPCYTYQCTECEEFEVEVPDGKYTDPSERQFHCENCYPLEDKDGKILSVATTLFKRIMAGGTSFRFNFRRTL